MAGAQRKMVRIGENDFRAEFLERFIAQAFYGGLRADRQKERRLDHAVGSSEATAARSGRIGFRNFERKVHSRSVSGENPCNGGTQQCEKQEDAYSYACGF